MKKTLLKNLTGAMMLTLATCGITQAQTSFVTVGTAGDETTISANTACSFTSVATCSENGIDVPYLAYVESANSTLYNGGTLIVKKYINNTWTKVGSTVLDKATQYTVGSNTITTSSTVGASYPCLKADNSGKLYLAFVYRYSDANTTDATFRIGIKVYDTKASNIDWTFLGDVPALGSIDIPTGSSSVPYMCSIAFDSNNIPYVVYSENPNGTGTAGSFSGVVKYFNNNVWSLLGGAAFTTTDRVCSPDIAIAGDTTYVMYHVSSLTTSSAGSTSATAGVLKLYTIANNATTPTWTSITAPNTTASTRSPRLAAYKASAFSSTKVYAIYANTSSSTYPNYAIYNSATATWSTPAVIQSKAAAYLGILAQQNADNFYVSFRESSSPLYLHVWKITGATNTKEELDAANAELIQTFPSITGGKNGSLFVAFTKPGATVNTNIYPKVKEAVSVLSVSLASFTAKAGIASVKLEWTTIAEINNKKFVIERSANGIDFTTIGEVNPKGPSAYNFTDYSPLSGINYYRLVQVNEDNISTSLGTVEASVNTGSAFAVYPNPTSGSITLSGNNITAGSTVTLTDIFGKVVYKEAVAHTAPSYTLNIKQTLAAGQYILKVTSNSLTTTSKIIVY